VIRSSKSSAHSGKIFAGLLLPQDSPIFLHYQQQEFNMRTGGLTGFKLTLPILLTAQLCGAVTDIYVSPKGSDTNPGSRKAPFATLVRARDAARDARRTHTHDAITIHLSAGRHLLREPLVLTPLDSGVSAEAPLRWSGADGASISGGRSLSGWTRCGKNIWMTQIPWLKPGELFYSLFADNRRLVRARTPDAGSYHYTRQLVYDKESGNSCTGMLFYPDTVADDIQSSGAHMVLFHKWVTSHNLIETVDTEHARIMFTAPAGIFLFDPETRFYIEGVKSALTAPDEWYLDPRSSELLLCLPEGADPNRMEIIAPAVMTTLIQVKGHRAAGDKVRNLIFENITFEHTDANLAPGHPKSVQGAHFQRGAFNAEGLHSSVIRNCTFTRIGENGVCLLNGCRSNRIEQNHIYDMGSGGVYLPEQKPAANTEEDLCAANTVCDNLIHDGGLIYRAGVGVFLGGNASYNRILHNEIFNLSWMGVHAGWSWSGLVPAATHHNEIAYNHIHHLGNGVLCDIGGIYTIGVSPGTVIHNNRIHDIRRYTRDRTGYGGWGIYLDAGSSQITVASNLVYNTQDGGFHLHNDGYPWGNRAHNNIFAISDSAQIVRNNIKDTTNGLHIVFENNIVYGTNHLVYGGGNWKSNSVFSADNNCFHSTAALPLDFAGQAFGSWQAGGKDRHSLIADPLFRDLRRYDFRLPPSSPAIALGFRPFDFTLAGLTPANPLRKLRRKIPLRPLEVAEPDTRPFRIDESYETYDLDSPPVASLVSRNVASRGYLVTAEKSAAGKKSLKIADGPGFKFAYEPHLCYQIPEQNGTWRIAFDLLHTPGARLIIETRDWPPNAGYHSGPVIQINADGSVRAGTAEFTLRPELWNSFEILCTQGEGIWSTWHLTIHAGQAEQQIFTMLAPSPGFRKLNWFGLISPETAESVVYLDNLVIEMTE